MYSKKVLGLRTTDVESKAYRGFKWPEYGSASTPYDGLKTEYNCNRTVLIKGEGDPFILPSWPNKIWQVVEIVESDIVFINSIIKVPNCNVVYSGSRPDAVAMIKKAHPEAIVVFSTVSVGDNENAIVGDEGFAIAGDCGTATAGFGGTAIAGHYGSATVGDYGTATAGISGTVAAGRHGSISIRYWDNERYRTAIGYIGEDGLLPNVSYRFDNGKFVQA